MKLSDLTLIQILGAILVINGALAGGVNELTDLLGPTMAKHVLSVCVIGSGICGGFITMFGGIGSQVRNVAAAIAIDPLQSKIAPIAAAMDKATAAKAAVIMAVLLSGLFAFSGDASAQIKLKPLTGNIGSDLGITPSSKPPALTGNIEADVQALWKKIGALTKADLNYAMAKAKAANTNGAAIRLQCLQAISDANDQANGTGLKNPDGTDMARPDPALVTGIEDVAELVDNLSPQGRLFTSCAGAAQMFKTNTLAVISAIVTGAAGIAALPAGL